MPPITTELPGTPASSPYRKKDALRFSEFAAFRVVDSLTPFRGSPAPHEIPAGERNSYIVICRGATSGRFGKCVQYRAIHV